MLVYIEPIAGWAAGLYWHPMTWAVAAAVDFTAGSRGVTLALGPLSFVVYLAATGRHWRH